MGKLATAADYRGETSTGRPGCRLIFSVVRTGVAALRLAVFSEAPAWHTPRTW